MCLLRRKGKIEEIIHEVEAAIEEVFEYIRTNDYNSFVLLIGRGEVFPGLKNTEGSDCVMDYQMDRYHDETRERFYLNYLNRNYRRDGFDYSGKSGIDDLSIEMMIYTHLWESYYFLKSLKRIASIVNGDNYLWEVVIPDGGKCSFVKGVITAFQEKKLKLGDIIEKGYNSDIRNSFAHALYNVDVFVKTITLRPRRGERTITFSDFQQKFLYSVILMNKLQNMMENLHDEVGKCNALVTKPFLTPDGLEVQVYACMEERGGKLYPEIRLVKTPRSR